MKTLIVGAGIIGSIYGWALAQAGHDVTHLVRPGRAAMLKDGMEVDMVDRRKSHAPRFKGRYLLKAVEDLKPDTGWDGVIVPTKHYRLTETLREIAPQIGEADVLLLTQNWKGTAEIDTILPPTRYAFGDAKAGGSFRSGRLVAAISSIDLGQVGGRRDACLEKSHTLFVSADIETRVRENMLHYLWVQYAMSVGLWPALVEAGSFPALLSSPALIKRGLLAMQECFEVVERRGVNLDDYPELAVYRNLTTFGLVKFIMGANFVYYTTQYTRRTSSHALSDPQEVGVFYDDLLTSGRELGVPMPVFNEYKEVMRRFTKGA